MPLAPWPMKKSLNLERGKYNLKEMSGLRLDQTGMASFICSSINFSRFRRMAITAHGLSLVKWPALDQSSWRILLVNTSNIKEISSHAQNLEYKRENPVSLGPWGFFKRRLIGRIGQVALGDAQPLVANGCKAPITTLSHHYIFPARPQMARPASTLASRVSIILVHKRVADNLPNSSLGFHHITANSQVF